MARSLSTNIYGSDTTAMADMISSDALGSPSPNAHSGAPSGASPSKGASGNSAVSEKGDVTVISDKNDSRARTKGNHCSQD